MELLQEISKQNWRYLERACKRRFIVEEVKQDYCIGESMIFLILLSLSGLFSLTISVFSLELSNCGSLTTSLTSF